MIFFGAAVRPGGRPSGTLRRRVDAAAAFGARFANPLYVPTGGVGRHGPSEAFVMAGLLADKGVLSTRILLEETGTDTLSSARAVVRLLRAHCPGTPVYVATSGYHSRRAAGCCCASPASLQARAPPPPPAENRWQRWVLAAAGGAGDSYDAALAVALRVGGRW